MGRRGVSKALIIGIVAIILISAGAALIYLSRGPPPKPGEEEGRQEEVVLTIISRHPTDILLKTRDLFLRTDIAKEYNIKDIKTVVIPEGLWKQYIQSGQADVAWGGGPTLFDGLYLEGLLAPYAADFLLEAVSQIPDELAGSPMKRVGEDGKIYWVAAAISSFGFTVNHKRLKDYNLPVPRKWRDLSSPTFGKPLVDFGEAAVGIADPTQSTSNTRMYQIMLQAYGWEEGWRVLTLLAANSVVYSGSSDVRDAVIRGDIPVGITIDFYGYTAKQVNPDCEYIIPEGESIVNGDPIALVKNSKHPEAAQAFIAWVLTDGQVVWLDPSINRLPSNPKIFDTPEGEEREDLHQAYKSTLKTEGIPFNETLAGSYVTVMQWYFKSTLVDVNDYLKKAWIAILTKYFRGELSDEEFKKLARQLGQVLEFVDPSTGEKVKFTEKYAISIQQKFLTDAAFRDAVTSAWKKAAIEKYESIAEAVGG